MQLTQLKGLELGIEKPETEDFLLLKDLMICVSTFSFGKSVIFFFILSFFFPSYRVVCLVWTLQTLTNQACNWHAFPSSAQCKQSRVLVYHTFQLPRRESVDLDKLSVSLRVVCLYLTHSANMMTNIQCQEAKSFIHTKNICTY